MKTGNDHPQGGLASKIVGRGRGKGDRGGLI